MEFHEIRYFLALSDALNFTRAAEQCNVSQPALTRAIKSLEAKLGGGPLVHRERGNTHLTELGRTMEPYFRHMVDQLKEAQAHAHAFVNMSDVRLKIGLMCTIGPVKLVDMFSEFTDSHPRTQIELVDGPVTQIEDLLAKGDLDVAVYCRPHELDERFHAIPLFREQFLVAIGPDHRLAREKSLSMRDLNQERYLGRVNCEFFQHLRTIRLELGGIEFQRPYSSDRDDWVQCMVKAGIGFTYMPAYAVSIPGIVTLPLVDPEVWRTVQLVTVRGRPHSPAVGAFVRTARSHAWDGKVMMPTTEASLSVDWDSDPGPP